MHKQNGNINKELENIKRNQKENPYLKSTITLNEKCIRGFKSRFNEMTEKNSKLDDKIVDQV